MAAEGGPCSSGRSDDPNALLATEEDKEMNHGKDAEGSSATMEYLRAMFQQTVRLTEEKQEEKPEQLLEELTLDGVVKYIKSEKCKNILVMVGAGISTSAGIPDFRSPGSGIYANLKKYNLPTPECMFDINYFKENPHPFFHLAKELFPGKFKPTPCHYFLRLLHQKGLLKRLYTQNIDTLERVAGIPADKVVEAHGTFYSSHCINTTCHQEYSLSWMKEKIFCDTIPTCTKCNSVVKPDIVFFGECLPDRFFKCAEEDFPVTDLLIVIGTSLTVQPFAGLVDYVPKTTPRLLINKHKSGQINPIAALLVGPDAGLKYDCPTNYRDVCWLGPCDNGCQVLADALGWGDELRKLVEEEHAAIDKKDLPDQQQLPPEDEKKKKKTEALHQ